MTTQHPYLTDKAAKAIEESFGLTREAWRILDLVVTEWSSDPTSVQCFDLRIVNRAKEIIARRRQIDKHDFSPMLSDD